MSRYSMGNLTGQLYDSLLQRRKAVEYEKTLLFNMQKEANAMQRHRDNLDSAKSAGGGRGGSGGGLETGWIAGYRRHMRDNHEMGDVFTRMSDQRARRAVFDAEARAAGADQTPQAQALATAVHHRQVRDAQSDLDED